MINQSDCMLLVLSWQLDVAIINPVLPSSPLSLPTELNFEKGKIALDTHHISRDDESSLTPYRLPQEEDFNLLHTILYYLYTDRITFGSPVDTQISDNLPNLCSTEEIYMASDRMHLEELKSKALKFLKLSCTPQNITSRIVSKFAELHEEVADVYTEYFKKNWQVIKNMDDFKRYVKNDPAKDDLDEVVRITIKLLVLMQDANF